MKKLLVYYPAPIITSLDRKIKKTIEGFGGAWMSAGVENSTGNRDNSFLIADECCEIICAKIRKMGLICEVINTKQ